MTTLLSRANNVGTTALRRGAIGIIVFVVAWEVATRLDEWTGVRVPLVGQLPPPSAVVLDFLKLAGNLGYWNSWSLSFQRVLAGFAVALLVGGTLGLLMATRPWFKHVVFPVFESLRPIPPLAWVPIAIIFWPTQELSITFVTFLGALFPVVLNTVGGADEIDRRRGAGAQRIGLIGFSAGGHLAGLAALAPGAAADETVQFAVLGYAIT